jgi:lysozyme
MDVQVTLFVQLLAAAAPLQLPPMVDLEDSDGLDPDLLTDWAIRVLQWVEELTGVRPVFYTNRWFLANAVQPERLSSWELSLAAYTDQAEWIDPRATWWQYAQNVRVPWAPQGPVDLQRHRGPLT